MNKDGFMTDDVKEPEEDNFDCGHSHTLPNIVDMIEEVEDKCVACGTVVRKGKVQWENEVTENDDVENK